MNNYRGQALPYFFMMMVVLLLCWMMIINLGRLMYEKMMVQNAADNAALSIAAYRARVLNKLGQINYLIGCALYGTEAGLTNFYNFAIIGGPYGVCPQVGAPILPMRFVDDKQKVACAGDMLTHFCSGTDMGSNGPTKNLVSAIRNLVKGMVTVGDSIRLPYPGGSVILARDIARKQEINGKGEETGPNTVVPLAGLSLGLKRNQSGIKYYQVKSFCISIPPIPIVLPPGLHTHWWTLEDYAEEEKAWLYGYEKDFYKNHKIIVQVTKNNKSPGYPLGAGLLGGIQWPDIMAISAAAVYNDGGPMFPIEDVEEKDASNKISPVIDEYKKAENKGWRAHLVPVGSGLLH